jgi:hypothetical protein
MTPPFGLVWLNTARTVILAAFLIGVVVFFVAGPGRKLFERGD